MVSKTIKEGSTPSAPAKTEVHPFGWASFFLCGVEPERVCAKRKVACGKFSAQSGADGYCRLRRSASYKYAKQTVKSVYQLHLKKNTIFGVLFYFYVYIRLEPERVCAKRKVAFCKKVRQP